VLARSEQVVLAAHVYTDAVGAIFGVPVLGVAVASDRLQRESDRIAIAGAVFVDRGKVAENAAPDLLAGTHDPDGFGDEEAGIRVYRDLTVEGENAFRRKSRPSGRRIPERQQQNGRGGESPRLKCFEDHFEMPKALRHGSGFRSLRTTR
jgi:hypothetical protein